MRVPPSPDLAKLLAMGPVGRVEVEQLVQKAGTDPARKKELALDLLSLGARVDDDALKAARDLLGLSPTTTTAKNIAELLGQAGALASAADTLDATATLSSLSQQLVVLTSPVSVERETLAGELLKKMEAGPGRGDAALPEGDPFAAVEWPAAGWRGLSETNRLADIVESRGFRVPGLRVVDESAGWWAGCPTVPALFRAPRARASGLSVAELDEKLKQVDALPPPVATRDEVLAVLAQS